MPFEQNDCLELLVAKSRRNPSDPVFLAPLASAFAHLRYYSCDKGMECTISRAWS